MFQHTHYGSLQVSHLWPATHAARRFVCIPTTANADHLTSAPTISKAGTALATNKTSSIIAAVVLCMVMMKNLQATTTL